MSVLYQRLKDLDGEKFANLIHQLLLARYPGLKIGEINGAGGDDGIDCFAGWTEAPDGPETIWQSKAFRNGVAKAQQKQVEKSLKRALEKWKPKRWVLCVPINLTIKENQWFLDLKKRHADVVGLDLLSAGELVSHLLQYRAVSRAFFADADLDTESLRAVVSGADRLTDEQARQRSEVNVADYVSRLKARDGRFEYSVTVATLGELNPQVPAGALFSFTQGHSTVSAFPGDVEALGFAPPAVHFESASNEGISKIEGHIRTGLPVTLTGHDGRISTDIGLLADALGNSATAPNLMIGAARPSTKLPIRLTFANPQGRSTVYEHISFKWVRAGSDEWEITTGARLPINFTFLLDFANRKGKVHMVSNFEGQSFEHIVKVFDALGALRDSGSVELYHLDLCRKLVEVKQTEQDLPNIWFEVEDIARKARRVEQYFCLKLAMPTEQSIEDYRVLSALSRAAEGKLIGFGPFRLPARKGTQAWGGLLESGSLGLLMQVPAYCVHLWGRKVLLGSIEIHFPTVGIRDSSDALRRWEEAADGDEVEVQLEPAEGSIQPRSS